MEDDQDESSTTNSNSRHRSPVFDKEEVKVLLDLINEYKTILLNKSVTGPACRAKELTWAKVTKKFNSHGFKNLRTIDGLKYKWRNLITNARRQSKNLIDVNHEDIDEFTSQVLSLIYDEDINNSEIVLPPDFEEDFRDATQQKQNNIDKKEYWVDNASRELEDSSGDDCKVVRNRSMNFSPQECKLLLQCVRAEKKHVFCKGNTTKDLKMKNCAWSRITEEYNSRSPQKRTRKVLHTKFFNMKRLAKGKRFFKNQFNSEPKHVRLFDENFSKEIKAEPLFEIEDEQLNDDDKVDSDNDDFKSDELVRVDSNQKDDSDPLCAVLNSDSGLGSSVNVDSFSPFENNEVVKLKMELLKHKIENAKLKKKSIENAIQEETKARELSAIERALRLRAARLEAVAAEMRLPPEHPALAYTAVEIKAQSYLSQYQT